MIKLVLVMKQNTISNPFFVNLKIPHEHFQWKKADLWRHAIDSGFFLV